MNDEKLAAHLLEVMGDVMGVIALAISEGDADKRAQAIRQACAIMLDKAQASGLIEADLTDEQREEAITFFGAQILAGLEAVVA
ncbi:hypothetical protein [Paenibacillus macerans]|uniref:hypothetical protein n=1 Tax=Paenibacillus macerans TaxID=44252 RepID=UPI003D31DF00